MILSIEFNRILILIVLRIELYNILGLRIVPWLSKFVDLFELNAAKYL